MPRYNVRSSNQTRFPVRYGSVRNQVPEPSSVRMCLFRLILAAEYGIVVRCGRLELRRTGIYHLVCCHDTVSVAHIVDLCPRSCRSVLAITLSGNSIRFASFNSSTVSGSLFRRLLHLNQDCQLIDEPLINLGNIVNHHHKSIPRRSASAITQILRSSTTCKLFYQFLIWKVR